MNVREEEFLSVNEISLLLHISYDSALILVKDEIPHFKVGRCFKVRAVTFRKWYKTKEKDSVR